MSGLKVFLYAFLAYLTGAAVIDCYGPFALFKGVNALAQMSVTAIIAIFWLLIFIVILWGWIMTFQIAAGAWRKKMAQWNENHASKLQRVGE